MNVPKKKRRKAFVDEKICVACGCCAKVCPMGAIQIPKGIIAMVDLKKCVGCCKCSKECPSTVITIRDMDYEKEMV